MSTLPHDVPMTDLAKDLPIPPQQRLATMNTEERAVFAAAFGAFVGQLSVSELVPDRPMGAMVRGMKAVRWFRQLKAQGEL